MLNAIVRMLLQKEEVPSGEIDERSFALEASAAGLLTALAPGGNVSSIRDSSLKNITLFWNRELVETFSSYFT